MTMRPLLRWPKQEFWVKNIRNWDFRLEQMRLRFNDRHTIPAHG
jgi:hypothetical protein